MTRVIHCECGEALRGRGDDELVTAAERHIAERHADLVGAASRADLLAMAADEPPAPPESPAAP